MPAGHGRLLPNPYQLISLDTDPRARYGAVLQFSCFNTTYSASLPDALV